MTEPSSRRLLDVEIPAQPEVLVKLSLLLAEDDVDLHAASRLISSDMALAAAVLKTVNSAMYGLRGRVQSVQQAITYLGTREVASVTFAMGLRAVFPPAPELEPVWQRARVRALLMGRIAGVLGLDAWAAHSAGLFEECGKAVMFRHATERYKPLLPKPSPTRSCSCSSTRSSASATTRSALRCARAGASRRRRSTASATT
jgi:Predicted signal transduction protein